MDEHKREELERKRAEEAEALLSQYTDSDRALAHKNFQDALHWCARAGEYRRRAEKAESLAVHYAEALETTCRRLCFYVRYYPPEFWREQALKEAQDA